MLFFALGSAAFGLFLGWLTFQDFRAHKPDGVRGWFEAALIVAAQVCLWAVTIRAFF